MPTSVSAARDRHAPARSAAPPSLPRVAFQGELGAFGEAAIRMRWGAEALPFPARSFDEVVALVSAGAVEHAVLPVWNSTIGPIAPALAALEGAPTPLATLGEIDLPVRHALLALPGATLDGIRAVGSHPAALGQCATWFARRPGVTAHRAYDTAGAARELGLLAGGGPSDSSGALPWYAGLTGLAPRELAVLASAAAAEAYGLAVLADAVQDDPTNLTRFRVVSA